MEQQLNTLSPKMWKIDKYSIPAIGWGIVIFILMAIPGNKFPEVHFNWISADKLVHFSVFGLWSFLLMRWLTRSSAKAVLSVFVIGLVFSSITETLQATVFINRSGDPRDVLANMIGISGGILIYRLLKKKTSIL